MNGIVTSRSLSPRALAVINAVKKAADHPPNPESSLRNAARTTTIFGRMLEEMADNYAKSASPAAKIITRLGLFGYGLVEVSVPRSLWYHFGKYWLKLLALLGTAMFLLGVVFRSDGTWGLGLLVIFVACVLLGLRDFFTWLIRQRNGMPLTAQFSLSVLVLVLCLGGLCIFEAEHIQHALSLFATWIVSVHVALARHLAWLSLCPSTH